MKKKGFTLIELILVMALLAILAIMLIGNFNAALKKGRDAQRKNDLAQLQKALEMYYEDNKTYPTFTNIFGKKLCLADNCTNARPSYMVKTPTDPSSSKYTYVYYPGPALNGFSNYYYLYSYIENDQDQGQNVNMSGFINPDDASTTECKAVGSTTSTLCRYYVSSSSAPQLTPAP
jgi:general secretion pathway protein G